MHNESWMVALRQALKLERILFDRQFGSDHYKRKKKKTDEIETNRYLKVRIQNLGQILSYCSSCVPASRHFIS